MKQFDLLFINVKIIDGTGAPGFHGALAVQGNRIAKLFSDDDIVPTSDAREIVDCKGMVLTPGFIDIHSHSDLTVLTNPEAESRILQGVTTELCGNCGLSIAPVPQGKESDIKYYLQEYLDNDAELIWNSLGEYMNTLQKTGHSTNMAFLAGHGNLRIAAMGFSEESPDENQMQAMKDSLKKCLEDGAWGMSTGLIYPPGSFARSQELEDLAAELKPYNGIYTTHMRNEGAGLLDSITETIALGRNSGIRVQVSHFKEIDFRHWREYLPQAAAMINQARAEGIDIAFDQYPYTASATGLSSNIPAWAFEGGQQKTIERLMDPATRKILRDEANDSHIGRWDKIIVSYAEGEENKTYVGHSITEIAEMTGKDPADACFDVILSSGFHSNEVNFGMCEEDIEHAMSLEYGAICSDGEARPLNHPGLPHPRLYGAFPRVIAHYSRERQLFPLETAIHKMTGIPRDRIGLTDRGLIREGMKADIVIFNPETITDTPSYTDPGKACQGIHAVYVNGVLTASQGVHTGARAGEILRR